MAKTHRYNDPESRRAFWKDVCDHISQGYSMKSYPSADEDTIYSYARKFPEDCPISELDEAKRKSCFFWEKIGLAGATGKVDGFNSASWIFNMKNRFGWRDKQEIDHKSTDGTMSPVTDEDKEIIKRYMETKPKG